MPVASHRPLYPAVEPPPGKEALQFQTDSFARDAGLFAMGKPARLASPYPVGLEVVMVGAVEGQPLHLIDRIAGKLNRLPGMFGQVLADLAVEIVDAEKIVRDRPRRCGTAAAVNKSRAFGCRETPESMPVAEVLIGEQLHLSVPRLLDLYQCRTDELFE